MTDANLALPQPGSNLPLWLKLAYTAFMAVLVPVYWHYYGPTNFLYFCDLALLIILVGIWIESPFLVSMCAVGILALDALWVADFLSTLVGFSLIGITDYMFNHENSLFLRGLSLYHGWLPFLLLYLVRSLGFDRRALPAWALLAWVLMLVCFFFMPPPNPEPGLTPVNINYVWGPSDYAAQNWVSPAVWLIGLMIGFPLLMFVPTHFLLLRFAPKQELPAYKRGSYAASSGPGDRFQKPCGRGWANALGDEDVARFHILPAAPRRAARHLRALSLIERAAAMRSSCPEWVVVSTG